MERSDRVGYHGLLTVWRDAQPEPGVKRVIGHWLDVLAEIDPDGKSVLAVLPEARTLS